MRKAYAVTHTPKADELEAMHNRRKLEAVHKGLYASERPKDSQAWSVLKYGCAIATGVVLALLLISSQRVDAPRGERLAVSQLLKTQKTVERNPWSKFVYAAPNSHQLRLQSDNVVSSAVHKVIPEVQHYSGDAADFASAPPVEAPVPVRKGKKVIWSTKLANNDVFEVVDEFIPADCMAQPNTDYDGPAVRWGLHPSPKIRSAAACCQACKDWKPSPLPCNTWVFCPDPSGLCWSADIWNHTTGECWLKWQEHWDENPIIDSSNIQIVHKGAFPEAYRNHHKTAPVMVPWMSGSIIGVKRSQAR